jgi:hypothetical protein
MTKITTTAATLQSNGARNRRRDADGDEDGDGMTIATTMTATMATAMIVDGGCADGDSRRLQVGRLRRPHR